MKGSEISGLGVALVTPFKKDLSIDFDALERILDHIISGGADFLVVLGTTGEAALLSLEERLEIIRFVKQKAAGRLPIVLGYGGISTAEMIEGFGRHDFEGIDALLVVTPYYVKPSQEGLIRHYTTLADASPLPLILYNVPGRTGINMEIETTLELARHPNIIGIKEASGKLFQIEEIILRKPADFKLYSGDDSMTFHLVNVGADGVISVMGNAMPAETETICSHPHVKTSAEVHLRLRPLTKSIFLDGNPSGIIYLLSRMGLCENVLRLPLVPVSQKTAEIIDRELALLK